MSTSRWLVILSIVSACATATTTPSPIATHSDPAKPELRDARFVATIATAAREYTGWGRVDESPNIAPELCRMPTRGDYGSISHVRRSAAPDGPHGTKLYYLWASQQVAYLALGPGNPIADGFTIVKQSFAATPTPPSNPRVIGLGRISEPVGWIETDHGRIFTGEPTGLYVMTKVGNAEGTDEGWVYGTVSATGEVTSAGRVASCMGCHEAATHGRLFGLQPTKKLVDAAPKPQ